MCILLLIVCVCFRSCVQTENGLRAEKLFSKYPFVKSIMVIVCPPWHPTAATTNEGEIERRAGIIVVNETKAENTNNNWFSANLVCKHYYFLFFVLEIPLTSRPTTSPGTKKRHTQQQEPPPSYTTLQRSPCAHKDKGTMNHSSCDAYKQQVSKKYIFQFTFSAHLLIFRIFLSIVTQTFLFYFLSEPINIAKKSSNE